MKINLILINSIIPSLISCAATSVNENLPNDFARVLPVAETSPVLSRGDSADDSVIWINKENVNNSLIIGTDKNAGIEVYRLDGMRVQTLTLGRLNNVDLRVLPDEPSWSAIAAASNRTTKTISLFAIGHDGNVNWLSDSEINTGLSDPYGLCMFASTIGIQIFVNDRDGRYQQWLISRSTVSSVEQKYPSFSSKLLREFTVSSGPEGCVVDDLEERLFVGLEEEGVRYVDTDYQEPAELVSIADIDGEILAADVEGLTLYIKDSAGYLVVSSQGNNSYAIYDRMPPFTYRGSFIVGPDLKAQIDGTQETDGISISSELRTREFPEGILVVQDGINTMPQERQNFKYVSWESISQAIDF